MLLLRGMDTMKEREREGKNSGIDKGRGFSPPNLQTRRCKHMFKPLM